MLRAIFFSTVCAGAIAYVAIGDAALVSEASAQTAAAPAKGDPAAGARLYAQCKACHSVEPGGRNGVGPNLSGIMGAKAGAKPGYAYSPAMKQSNLKWTPQSMDSFLKKPSAAIPRTKMMYAGMANPKARADVIAYLSGLKK